MRRVQELITDPLLYNEDHDIITMANELYAGQPGSNVLAAGAPYVRAMYVWGPGDSPTSGVDELLVQIDPRDTSAGAVTAMGGKPWYAVNDAQGDLVALLHKRPSTNAIEIAAQWTYSPYGEVLTYEQLHTHCKILLGPSCVSAIASRVWRPQGRFALAPSPARRVIGGQSDCNRAALDVRSRGSWRVCLCPIRSNTHESPALVAASEKRARGFEPPTYSLEGCHSTTELRPQEAKFRPPPCRTRPLAGAPRPRHYPVPLGDIRIARIARNIGISRRARSSSAARGPGSLRRALVHSSITSTSSPACAIART